MTEAASKAHDRLFITGIVMIAFSSVLHCLHVEGFFVFTFLLALVYFFLLAIEKKWDNIFLFLVLFLISAYELNLSIKIFEQSVTWLTVLLVGLSANLVFIKYIHRAPLFIQRVMAFLLGMALVLFLYLSCYLLPIYLLSAFVFFVLGISLHAFAPILFVIFIILRIIKLVRSRPDYAISIFAGIAAILLVPVVFCWQWQNINRQVWKNYNQNLIADNALFPSWIKVAQKLPCSFVTLKYLKSDLVYTTPNFSRDFWSFDLGGISKNFDEGRKHDPLVMIAAAVSNEPEISQEDRLNIIGAMYGFRHQTQDRLWSGDNLHTTNVISNAKIWPAQRIAYTELTVTVNNKKMADSWRFDQEAIYTFHMPEGGVVSSLSLWIKGKECKGVMTTRGKADSAYREIVGVERHDPSVVQWQEGNTVTVRVFPVDNLEPRIFRIGITAPLTCQNKTLNYDDIWFEGPEAGGATETRQIEWATEPIGMKMPAGFKQNKPHRYLRDGNYDPDFQLTCSDPGFQNAEFDFDSTRYLVSAYDPTTATANLSTIYLDINSSWDKAEVQRVRELLSGKRLFIYDDKLVDITQQGTGTDEINDLLSQRFSLFPFQEIADPDHSMVISACDRYSPNLADLKNSDFADSLAGKLSSERKIRLFVLGNTLSPYLKGLKEHRVFDFEAGDLSLLKSRLAMGRFAVNAEDDSDVVIDNAGIMLARRHSKVAASEIAPSSATPSYIPGPDHLMRLFAYNHIMSELKNKLFTNAEADSTLVGEAKQAFIITPLSSLIVLETQQDYDRFKIGKNDDSLGDASLKSKGAVPEPHEWALIIVACLLLVFLKLKKNRIAVLG